MTKSNRLGYIDSAKAISIIMIMFGHITSYDNPVDNWMSSFKVTIFYVISGFLIAYTGSLQRRTPGQFVQNLLKTLAWPYFTFSIIAIASKCFYLYAKHKPWAAITETFYDNLYASVFLKGINSMWFLPTLFFGEVILLMLYYLPRWSKAAYALLGLYGLRAAGVSMNALTGLLNLSGSGQEHMQYVINMFGKSIVAAWFLGFGYLTYLLMERARLLHERWKYKIILGLLFTVSNVYISQLNSHVDFNLMKMGGEAGSVHIRRDDRIPRNYISS